MNDTPQIPPPLPPASPAEPPPLPPAFRPRARLAYGTRERLTLPWIIALAIICLAAIALVARLIHGHSLIKQSDAIKTDLSKVQQIDKRLGDLKRRARLARTPQQRSEAHYLILAEIKTLPTKLSGYSRDAYENMRAISPPLNDATHAYNQNVAAFFGTDGKWLAPVSLTPKKLAQARATLQTLAAENQTLRALYQERLDTLARETDSGRRNRSLTQIHRLAETKKPAYNLVRDTDAKIYATMDAIIQLMLTNEDRWRHDPAQAPILQWYSAELARQSDAHFLELTRLFIRQRDAQLELLDLVWNG